MDLMFSIIVLNCILIILCDSVSVRDKESASVNTEFMGSHIKINRFRNKDKRVNRHVNIKNIFFDLETTKEYYYKETTYYNESVSIELLCYGTNLSENHTLTWHVVVGTKELATIRKSSNKPNSNFTLYYDLNIFDNETRLYCSLELSDATVINTDDYFVQMNKLLGKKYLEIAYCNVTHGFTPTKRCHYWAEAVGASSMTLGSEIDAHNRKGFNYIVPQYYSSSFSTFTHSCADGDTSIIKFPNRTATITDKKSFLFTESKNGTVLFCERLNMTMDTEDGSTALTIVTRQTYNERRCLYNENLIIEENISSDIIIGMIITFTVLVLGINSVGIILYIYRRVKNRGKNTQKQNTDDRDDVDLIQHLNGVWKKWKLSK